MGFLFDLLKAASGEGSMHSALGWWRQHVARSVDALVAATGVVLDENGNVISSGGVGLIAGAEFFALMPGDNVATIAAGAPIQFPQNGPAFGAISRNGASPSQFILAAAGVYEVAFQASIAEAGQLMLRVNGVEQAATVAGRATGTSQISNTVLIRTTSPNAILEVINPSGNATALTLTPTAGGTHAVSATLVVERIQ